MAANKSHLTSEKVVLADGSIATLFPVFPHDIVSSQLTKKLIDLLNYEVDKGDTYPANTPYSEESFTEAWRAYFCAILIEGDYPSSQTLDDPALAPLLLGTFYIKPNYPGNSSHVCNAGFLVEPSKRGKRIGQNLGKAYLRWAPELGYEYSVFNLVYASNTASVRIWDGLGFDRIGLVPGAGKLKGHTEKVDAIIFGKALTKTTPPSS